MAHGRDESANSCTLCGFSYVLKKRARLYELISYKGKTNTWPHHPIYCLMSTIAQNSPIHVFSPDKL